MTQPEQAAVEVAPQWEAPQLVVAEVAEATLNGGSTNFDAGTQS